MMILMMCVSGCVTNTRVIDSFCVWAKPITITKTELNSISNETLIQLDNFNRHYEQLCIGEK